MNDEQRWPHPPGLDGARLRQLREQKGYSQEALADMLGVTYQQVYRWEAGKNQPSAPMVAQLSTLLGISSDYLLHLREELTGSQPDGETSSEAIRLLTSGLESANLDTVLFALKTLLSSAYVPRRSHIRELTALQTRILELEEDLFMLQRRRHTPPAPGDNQS